MADIDFNRFAEELEKMPEAVYDTYEKVAVKTVDEYGKKLYDDLLNDSGSTTLAKTIHIERSYKKNVYYKFSVDWDDETPVNTIKGKNYGRDVRRPRGRSLTKSRYIKRNFSRAPATSHDLAYIINAGHAVFINGKEVAYVEGTHFIDRAIRRSKKWKQMALVRFDTEMQMLKNKMNKGEL